MPNPAKAPPDARGPDSAVTLLAVSCSDGDRACLADISRRASWKILSARACREAVDMLRAYRVPVVIAERQLPDGSWKDLLEWMGRLDTPPLLIVASQHADDSLWDEVLNQGGYDVLRTPFDTSEVVRVIRSAWLDWKRFQDSASAERPKSIGAHA